MSELSIGVRFAGDLKSKIQSNKSQYSFVIIGIAKCRMSPRTQNLLQTFDSNPESGADVFTKP